MMNLHVVIVAAKKKTAWFLLLVLQTCVSPDPSSAQVEKRDRGRHSHNESSLGLSGLSGLVWMSSFTVSFPHSLCAVVNSLDFDPADHRRMYIGSSLFDHFTSFGDQRCVFLFCCLTEKLKGQQSDQHHSDARHNTSFLPKST